MANGSNPSNARRMDVDDYLGVLERLQAGEGRTPLRWLTGVLAALLTIRGGLEALGPAGLYATRTFGDLLVPVLVGLLVAWIVVPLAATVAVMNRRGAL